MPEHRPTSDLTQVACSLAAAVLAWAAYLAVPAPVSGVFTALLILLTVNAVVTTTFTPSRFSPFYAWLRWYDRRSDTMIYRAAVDAYRALDIAPHDSERAELEDHVRHVRTAVCILNGWDPTTEADTGGRADQRILAWWAEHHPKDYALRDPQS